MYFFACYLFFSFLLLLIFGPIFSYFENKKQNIKLKESDFTPWLFNRESTCPYTKDTIIQIRVNGVPFSPKKMQQYIWSNISEYRVLKNHFSTNSLPYDKASDTAFGEILENKIKNIYKTANDIPLQGLAPQVQQDLNVLINEDLADIIQAYRDSHNLTFEDEFLGILDKIQKKVEDLAQEAVINKSKEFKILAKYINKKYSPT